MPAALLQSAAGALLLLAAALWPRSGEPVLLAVPKAAVAAAAFGVEGWRVLRVSEAGPFALVALSPGAGAPPLSALIAASGALFALRATPGGACITGMTEG
jgi:hypothetical protein